MESKSFPSNFDIAGRYAKPGQTFLITVELKKNPSLTVVWRALFGEASRFVRAKSKALPCIFK